MHGVITKILLAGPPETNCFYDMQTFNPLNAELNPICHFLALLGGANIVVVSRLGVNSYIYKNHLIYST
jgi:hypothetical protein